MAQVIEPLFQKLKNIRAIVFDVDGVLTNGNMLLLQNGEWLREMNIKDGYAIEQAVKKRYRICVISEDGSEAIGKRLDALGVKEIYFHADSKLAALEKFTIENEVELQQVLYICDDMPDIPCLKAAGLATCPHDAAPEVKDICDYIAEARGGRGAVREIIEIVLKSHSVWDV